MFMWGNSFWGKLHRYYAVMPKKTAGVSPSDEFGMSKMINKSAETPERKLGEVHNVTK